MKKTLATFVIATLITFVAMGLMVKASEKIIGKWKMEQVLEGDRDITKDLNPEGDRWIAFKTNGTFASGGGPYGANTGKYSIDDKTETLFLDSNAGEDDDSNWKFTFEGDKLIMSGVGTERQEKTKVIFLRADK